MIANTEGISLKEHSQKVAELAVYIANKGLKNTKDANRSVLMKAVKYSALFHDIGKATRGFQEYITNKISDKKSKKINFDFCKHQEISWSIIHHFLPDTEFEKVLTLTNQHNKEYLKSLILNAVYWHHGTTRRFTFSNKKTPSLDSLTTIDVFREVISDVKNIIAFANSIQSDIVFDTKPKTEDDLRSLKLSSMFLSFGDNDFSFKEVQKFNRDSFFIRNCLVSADRLVSKNSSKNIKELKRMIDDKLIVEKVKFVKSTDKNFNKKRFKAQKDIAFDAYSGKANTALIKAPCGFGKTMLGLLWNNCSDKKLLWVCPRNFVAESVYSSIVEILKSFNINKSVELILGGEKIESLNSKDENLFTSDIVITNIDNFLSVTTDNKYAENYYLIANADVVFDEFHEFVDESKIYVLFLTIMRMRHQLCNDAKTLLLSATPNHILFQWDRDKNNTIVFPNKKEHYKAIHSEPYKIKLFDEYDIKSIVPNSESLIVFNGISGAQAAKGRDRDGLILHSRFTDKDKEANFKDILNKYSKTNQHTCNKNIYSAPILQASVDISLSSLYEKVFNPDATLQRVGRVNRWGELKSANLNLYKELITNFDIFDERHVKQSESMIISTLYDINLCRDWFDYLKDKIDDKKTITLNELYAIYNSYFSDRKDIIEARNRKLERDVKLKEVYPIKFPTSKIKPLGRNANSNRLRSNGNEVYYTALNYKTNRYCEPISAQIYVSVERDFDIKSKNINHYSNRIKEANKEIFFEFDTILEQIKKHYIGVDDLCHKAKSSLTPFVRSDVRYDREYGIVKDNFYKQITK